MPGGQGRLEWNRSPRNARVEVVETSTKQVMQVIIGSTRPGRVGKPVGDWVTGIAREHDGFDVRVTDLAELDLPMMDEAKHPRFKDYEHDHTHAWSATIEAADAFVFVVPEYNHGLTAPVKNAVDYLHNEWRHKPVGVVSYGGVAAGTRAVEQLIQVLSPLGVPVLPQQVNIPFVFQFVKDGRLEPNEIMTGSAKTMLDELARQAPVLAQLRD